MKKINTIILIIILTISTNLFSQINQNLNYIEFSNPFTKKQISSFDSIRIANIPELEVPLFYKSANSVQLPAVVDNSSNIYFRPVTQQSGYECGQIAGQSFVFTYEINRLRNLNSSIIANQYPSHFTWNFLNDAYNYTGVSFFDTWEITRTCGTPNVVDYGGSLNFGGEKRWMTGYSKYYNGMKNRISGVYSIKCDSPEGVRILKTWLYDHLEGSSVGGVVAIYGQYCNPDAKLAAGTPEAGKDLISNWGSSPSHAWTIMGYNDSIRYDFNGDGQYTNDIDINGDGLVNVKDWEIGGLKLVNGYAGVNWGNLGFSYMMYKALADGMGNGGIWNSSVYVVKAKQNQNPLLTMKINMRHNRRFQVKVVVGVNQNTNANIPEYRMEYPIFNFHGGSIGMQGDTTVAAQSIEFGLDISPLLSYINVGQPAKYFLEVIEKDPSDIGAGLLNSLSLIDYSIGGQETYYPLTNVPLIHNDTTRFSIVKNMIFDKLNVQNDSMIAKIYHSYSHQLNAQFGTLPYKWDLKMDYNEIISNNNIPVSPTQVLNTGNSGYVKQNLNFNFPFFGKSYNQIYIYADGFIKFDNSLFNFPYLIDGDLLFRSHKMIAPFYADLIYGSSQKVLYEASTNSATIIWNAGVSGQSSSYVNVAMKIYSNGKIEFYYGPINITGKWYSALSGGDVINYQYSSLSNSFSTNTISKKLEYTPPDYPDNMEFDENGLFKAEPLRYYNTLINFKVTDNNNVTDVKSIAFKTYGMLFEYKIRSGNDSIINAGDTVFVSVKLKNIGANSISNANMFLKTSDTNVLIIDSFAVIGNVIGNDSININDAFAFIVSQDVIDGHFIELTGCVVSPLDTFSRGFSVRINSFLLKTGDVIITDGNNNVLEANETAAMMLQIKNIGGATATNLNFQLSTNDPYVTLNPGFAIIDTIKPFSTRNAFFIITTSANIPSNHLIVLNVYITGANNYKLNTFFFIKLGETIEDFETNNFNKYNWNLGGNINWFTSDSLKYMGNFSAKSGKITHSQTSYLSINQYVLADSYIKFYRKISCERDNNNHNYDYFAFYIDGDEKARWDGEIDWNQEVFYVKSGNHTFKWTYVKDNSVNTGADCAWLDNIIFPLVGEANPNLVISPMIVNKTIALNSYDTAIVNFNNTANGLVLFTNELQLSNSISVPWASTNINACGLNTGQNQQIIIQFDGTQLQAGNYYCQMIVSENFLTQKIIPIYLIVEDQTNIKENECFTSNCYPNPFNIMTQIDLNVIKTGYAKILVYDYSGKLVKELLNKSKLDKGKYSFKWDSTDMDGNRIAEGLYFCNIIVNDKSVVYKIINTR